jgi:hypothetical protein
MGIRVVEWTQAGGTVPVAGERVVYLKLVNRHGGASIITCDEKGTEISSTCLLTIGNDGRVKLQPSVNRNCGLSLVEPRRYIEVVAPE